MHLSHGEKGHLLHIRLIHQPFLVEFCLSKRAKTRVTVELLCWRILITG